MQSFSLAICSFVLLKIIWKHEKHTRLFFFCVCLFNLQNIKLDWTHACRRTIEIEFFFLVLSFTCSIKRNWIYVYGKVQSFYELTWKKCQPKGYLAQKWTRKKESIALTITILISFFLLSISFQFTYKKKRKFRAKCCTIKLNEIEFPIGHKWMRKIRDVGNEANISYHWVHVREQYTAVIHLLNTCNCLHRLYWLLPRAVLSSHRFPSNLSWRCNAN